MAAQVPTTAISSVSTKVGYTETVSFNRICSVLESLKMKQFTEGSFGN
jgi:glyceraldehyde-3-phosphate dehydrogenase/erythrose-4-phosphate dehydrogenase